MAAGPSDEWPPESRYWKRAVKGDTCWSWNGSHTSAGYATSSINRRAVYVHRWAHVLFVGPIPAGYVVAHTCDNPGCVNPAHLEAVSQSKNIQDSVSRGRHFSPGRIVTHCPQGHPYDEENTYHWRGRRMCRTCRGSRTYG